MELLNLSHYLLKGPLICVVRHMIYNILSQKSNVTSLFLLFVHCRLQLCFFFHYDHPCRTLLVCGQFDSPLFLLLESGRGRLHQIWINIWVSTENLHEIILDNTYSVTCIVCNQTYLSLNKPITIWSASDGTNVLMWGLKQSINFCHFQEWILDRISKVFNLYDWCTWICTLIMYQSLSKTTTSTSYKIPSNHILSYRVHSNLRRMQLRN